MNKISWHRAEIHYSERVSQNDGATKETETDRDITAGCKSELLMNRQPWRRRRKMLLHEVSFYPIIRKPLSTSLLLWSLLVARCTNIYLCSHPMGQICFTPTISKKPHHVYLAEPDTSMTTSFDLHERLRGGTHLDSKESRGGIGTKESWN